MTFTDRTWRDDLSPFDFLGLLLEFGETIQDKLEHAAKFARFDHVYEEAVEDLGMLRQSFGRKCCRLQSKPPARQ